MTSDLVNLNTHGAMGSGWGRDRGKEGGLKLGYMVLAYYFVLVLRDHI